MLCPGKSKALAQAADYVILNLRKVRIMRPDHLRAAILDNAKAIKQLFARPSSKIGYRRF
ncbi:hypothetical protein BH09VER1_BH09VER1_52790 [soil metagenome]